MMGINKICNTSIFIYTYKFLGPDLARAKKAVQFHHTAAPIKACVHYFYQIFIFSPNDSPSKTMKNAFYFILKVLFVLKIFKFLYFSFSFFFSISHWFRGWSKINFKVYDTINCLNRNSITHFVWYLEKEKRYDIETLSIDGVSDKEHFYRKIMQKMCSKS